MGLLNSTMIEKINDILNQKNSMPEEDVELTEAFNYLNHLVTNIKNEEELEKALIRFYRIRPHEFNQKPSPVSSIYTVLKKAYVLPDTPKTPEEALLSEFITQLFKQPAQQKSKGSYQELTQIDRDASTANLIYKTLANVEPGIQELAKTVPSFDWDGLILFVGHTRLHSAVSENNPALITLLLAAGANPQAQSMLVGLTPLTPLDLAITKQHNESVVALLSSPRLVSTLSEQLKDKVRLYLAKAFRNEKFDFVESVLKLPSMAKQSFIHAPYDEDKCTLLHLAAWTGQLGIVNLLIQQGSDVNARTIKDKYTPIAYVSGPKNNQRKPDHLTIAKILIQKMTSDAINDITDKGMTVLDWACWNKYKELADILLDYKDIKLQHPAAKRYNGALISSIYANWEDTVEKILSHPDAESLINLQDADGRTSLHIAASEGLLKMTQLLLEYGANTALLTNFHNTALSIVTGSGQNAQRPDHPAIVRLLLKHMTPDAVNAVTNDNKTALAWAIHVNNPVIVLILVQHEEINLDGFFEKNKTIDLY